MLLAKIFTVFIQVELFVHFGSVEGITRKICVKLFLIFGPVALRIAQ